MTRSRRAGLSRDEARRQPLYARMLGLQYLAPSGFLCFVFLEGAIALGILLALAELVSWWGVLVLPVTVAVMVKLNDVVAGALTRASRAGVRSSGPAGSSGRGTGVGEPGNAAVAVGSEDGVGVGGSGIYTSSRVGPQDGVGKSPAASEGLNAATQRSWRRRSPGARTVKLPPSVIAQAARDAGHDQGPYGRRAADADPFTREASAVTREASAVTPEATPFMSDGAPFEPEPEVSPFTPEVGLFAPRIGSDTSAPDRFLAAPDRFSAEQDQFSSAPDRFPAAPDRFPAAPDRFAAAPEQLPSPPDQLSRGADEFLPAPDGSPGGFDRLPPASDRFAQASDRFSEPYSFSSGYDSDPSTAPGITPTGHERWTTRDDDYLPPLNDGLHGGAAAAEPRLFSAMDPSTSPTEAAPINGPRATPRWTGYLDEQEQRTHQSAARRYE